MKRSGFLKRNTPLRNTRGQHRNSAPAKEESAAAPIPGSTLQPLRRGTYAGGTTGVPVKKDAPVQSEPYMRAVRDLGYCMLCGRACRPQFCHADEGKGMGLKTDCRLGWPGCGPGEWGPGCHYIVGSTGFYTKEERRVIEKRLGRKTRAAVKAAGTWPPSLAPWKES